MNKYGVFLARMQPLHNAHLWIIEQMLTECDNVAIILGSENKREMLRNPFDIELRKTMLEESLKNRKDIKRIEVYTLPDWSMETDNSYEWGRYLYYNIVSRIETKKFTIYYSDSPDIIYSWFEDYLLSEDRITVKLYERSKIFKGLSATKIRQAFEMDNIEYIKKYCPDAVVKRFNLLKNIWFKVKENPKEDFSMT